MVGSTCETQFKSFRLNKKLVSSTRRERMSTAGLRWGDVDGGGYAEWNRCLAYMDWVWMMLMRCGIHVRNDEKHQVELLLICRTLCKSCYMEVVFSHSDPFTSKQSVLMNDAPNIPFFRSVFVDSADIYMSLANIHASFIRSRRGSKWAYIRQINAKPKCVLNSVSAHRLDLSFTSGQTMRGFRNGKSQILSYTQSTLKLYFTHSHITRNDGIIITHKSFRVPTYQCDANRSYIKRVTQASC